MPFRGVSYHQVAQMQKYVSKGTNSDILNFDLCDLQK
jgi:hypothetical protein